MMKNNIFIVGYPKTGNTWLCRMIARIVKGHVDTLPSQYPNKEIAADVNNDIKEPSDIKIYKQHKTPQDLTDNNIDLKTNKFIVMDRDIMDTFMSSFFYFRAPNAERFVVLDYNRWKLLNPIYALRRLWYRTKLKNYLKYFPTKGFGKSHTMQSFYRQWRDISDLNHISFTTYSDLKKDTVGELKRILSEISIPADDKTISDAVDAEDFKKRKKQVEQAAGKDLTLGRGLQTRFMRKGTKNDYMNYLTKDDIDTFKNTFASNS